MTRNWRWAVLLASVVVAGCSSASGSTVLGTPAPNAAVVAVSELKATGSPVALKGKMVEKCPVAGCWFMLRDSGGLIKVDTKSAGFVVTDIPLNTEVTVTGTAKLDGEHRLIATGLKY